MRPRCDVDVSNSNASFGFGKQKSNIIPISNAVDQSLSGEGNMGSGSDMERSHVQHVRVLIQAHPRGDEKISAGNRPPVEEFQIQ
jgi:hypothetical protein